MIPSKHSFKLLSRAEIKKSGLLQARLKKKNLAVLEFKKDSQKLEELETGNKKRTFLKLAGVVGLGAVASLLFPKKAEALVFGSTPASNVVGIKNLAGDRINPAKEDDGNLEDIAMAFTTDTVGGYIRQNSDTPTIAMESDGNLEDIRDLFVTAKVGGTGPDGAAGGYIRQDSTGTIAKETGGNLATLTTTASTLASEDAITYLRKLVKLMESQAVTDSSLRQRVTVEGATITSGTITTVGTVSTITAGTITTVGSVTGLAGVDARYLYIDTAHNAYANAIRPNLVWS